VSPLLGSWVGVGTVSPLLRRVRILVAALAHLFLQYVCAARTGAKFSPQCWQLLFSKCITSKSFGYENPTATTQNRWRPQWTRTPQPPLRWSVWITDTLQSISLPTEDSRRRVHLIDAPPRVHRNVTKDSPPPPGISSPICTGPSCVVDVATSPAPRDNHASSACCSSGLSARTLTACSRPFLQRCSA
jgi:hypothetical protein